jgi:hypothetical protein
MLRFDCKHCGENIFDVQGIDHLGDLPHEWICSGCGRKFVAKVNKDGQLVVHQRSYPRGARVLATLVPEIPGEETGNGDG